MNIETWKANNDRIQWIQKHRDELAELIDKDIPRSASELSSWLEDNKHLITKALNNE